MIAAPSPVQERATDAARTLVASACDAVGALTLEVPRLVGWAELITARLAQGGTVLTAGNGGSATHAAHLASELVGRFRAERPGLAATCLSGDAATLTALGNDYGFEEVFARQVRAAARPGDVLVLFSTSGRSGNVVAAARAGREVAATTLAMTGPGPSPLADVADDVMASVGRDTAAVQDSHHVAVHVVCAALDELLGATS